MGDVQGEYGPIEKGDAYALLEHSLGSIDITSAKMYGAMRNGKQPKFLFGQFAKRAFSKPEQWDFGLSSTPLRTLLAWQSGIDYNAPKDLSCEPNELLEAIKSETSLGLTGNGPLCERIDFYFSLSHHDQNKALLTIRFRQQGSTGSMNTAYARGANGNYEAFNFGSGYFGERRRDFLISFSANESAIKAGKNFIDYIFLN